MCSNVVGISQAVGTAKSEHGQGSSVHFWDKGADNLSKTSTICLALATRLSIELSFTYQAGTQRMPHYAYLGLIPVTTCVGRQTNGNV